MKNSIRLLAGALVAAGLPLAASAQTITVTATIAGQCNMSSGTVALGSINLLSATVQNIGNTVSLTCNRGATVTVALNNGSNASGTQKRMLSATTTDTINYNITVPNIVSGAAQCPGSLPGTEWNATGTFVATSLYTASGGPRSIPLCVTVPGSQFPRPATDYTDTITATLTVT